MPRCYFYIRQGEQVYSDEEGVECESMENMEREAAAVAASLLRDHAHNQQYGSLSVEVRDEAGRPMLIAEAKVEIRRVH